MKASIGGQRSKPPSVTAALTLTLTGRYRRQGLDAAEAAWLWAESEGIKLTLVDDGGSVAKAIHSYQKWIHHTDLLLGPYSSGLVRAVAPLIEGSGRLLWNHGGSADDLARPGVVCVAAPSSTYFIGVVDEALARGVGQIVIVRGPGPFAKAVTDGAMTRAQHCGLTVRVVAAADLDTENLAAVGLLIAGSFEHDVSVVRNLRQRPQLVATVAAGIHAFGEELGANADDVLGPVHWWPTERCPMIGPSGSYFAAEYERRTGREPSYVAALAMTAGHLAYAALTQGVTVNNIRQWTTSTMLGHFALTATWQQVGYRPRMITWRKGRMTPVVRGQ